jgi:KRAB domain-containing zinc finger protein
MQCHTQMRPYNCDVPGCSYSTKIHHNLHKHKKNVHTSILYTCLLCGKNIKTHKYYKLHIARHNTETPGVFKCLKTKCKELFNDSNDLRKHAQEAHEITKNVHCNECGKYFAFKSILKMHIVSHWDWRPFKCDTPGCTYSSQWLRHLLKHKNSSVHTLSRFTCCHCGKMFKHRARFNEHEAKHKTNIPAGVLKCLHDGCQQSFCVSNDLKTHMKQHKLNNCDVPGCLFTSEFKHNLHTHRENVHSIWSHNCHLCGKGFYQSARLKQHVQKHDAGEPGVIKCTKNNCKQTFTSIADFKIHLDNHKTLQLQLNACKLSTNEFECQLCGKIIKSPITNFERHVVKHETGTPGVIKCIHQGCKQKQTFTSATELKQHVLQHWNVSSPRPFVCDFPQCKYASKTDKDRLNHKRRVHSSKFYNCQMCGKQFKHLSYVTQHIKRQHQNQINAENPNFSANESQEIICKDEIEEVIFD